jgi:uncharacterized 2Fe-2S/4Fe-4S cluster protein (DUF4445 family)
MLYGHKRIEVERKEKINLLELLLAHQIPIQAPCGGNGRCGKCQVLLTADGTTRKVLACHEMIDYDCTVEVPQSSLVQTDVLEETSEEKTGEAKSCKDKTGETDARQEKETNRGQNEEKFLAAVDLGTTTIAVALIEQESKKTVAEKKEWNQQVSFGADVISRSRYVMEQENGLEQLKNLVQSQIYNMIENICEREGFSVAQVKKVCISGNTIMQHIFAGLDPTPITLAPYVSETLFDEEKSYEFPQFPEMEVSFLPCISGYVGGDITSGLYSSGLYQKEGTYLFLDIGTNGEMAIGGKDGFVCCSVASGPAFEGAEITCGMTSVPGAVCHLDWKEQSCKFEVDVIGKTMATGFCGSGLIDLLAILLKTGVLDESGRLLSPKDAKEEISYLTMARLKNSLGYNFLEEDENGNGIFYLKRSPAVYLTIADVRKLQLAKAAIAAGIKMLLKETGKTYEKIDGLYLAGGLGESLNADNAAAIGMIPEALKDKITCIGNSSLAGAGQYLLTENSKTECVKITKNCRYVELAGNAEFNTEFIEQITFAR